MAASVWNHPSAIPLLRKLWIEGVPCTPLSERMSAALGVTVTRNAVIGKVHRLRLHVEFPRETGFESRNEGRRVVQRMAARRGPRPASQQPSVGNRRPGTDFIPDAGTAMRRKEAARSGQALVERVENGAGVVSLNARPFAQSTGCRWPLANGLICCNRISRKVYCAGHDAVAHAKSPQYRTEEQIAFATAMLTRFDGVVDLSAVPPPSVDTEWDGGRLAA